MNQKGISIIEIFIGLMILGVVATGVLEWVKEEKIAQQLGEFTAEFKGSSEPIIQIQKEIVTIDKSGVICLDGKKTIMIDGETYHLGRVKNTWGDLEGVDCL
jgi:hypothetical protein